MIHNILSINQSNEPPLAFWIIIDLLIFIAIMVIFALFLRKRSKTTYQHSAYNYQSESAEQFPLPNASIQSYENQPDYDLPPPTYPQYQNQLQPSNNSSLRASASNPLCPTCNQPLIFAMKGRTWRCDSCQNQDPHSSTPQMTSVVQSSGTAIIAQRSSHSDYRTSDLNAAPAKEEKIYFGFLGSRGSGKGKGFGTVKTWDIFFTNRRLICAKIGGSGGSAYLLGGVIGYAIAKKAEDIKRDKMAQKDLDSILASNKRNFEIPYEQIYQVEIIKGVLACSLNITDVNGNRYKFAIKKPECAPAIQTLYPLLGHKLNY